MHRLRKGLDVRAVILRQLSCLAYAFKDADVVCDGRAAHIEHSHQFRVGYLDASRSARELHRRKHVHGNASRTYRMAFGLEPA